jgi:hypothetical protein
MGARKTTVSGFDRHSILAVAPPAQFEPLVAWAA